MPKAQLIEAARQARERAYAPYSHYLVGAALLCADGRIYTGCNVENASYSLTICAERNAIFQAVADGQRDFVALAVIGNNHAIPCGACLQVMSEFAPTLPVYIASAAEENIIETSVDALLPTQFHLEQKEGDL